MAEFNTTIQKRYKDLDLNFIIHPVKKDINKNVDAIAIVNSVKNLVLTNFYERLFQPDIGSSVRQLLFENVDAVSSTAIERAILEVISNFEPRVSVSRIIVQPDFDQNAYAVTMEFFINNRSDPISINFQLERLR